MKFCVLKDNKSYLKVIGTLLSVTMLTMFSSCMKLVNERPVIDNSRSAITRTAIAAEYIKTNQLDIAKKYLEEALKYDSFSPEAYLMMGVLHQADGTPKNIEKADGYFRKALRLRSNYPQANNNYGVFLMEQKKLAEAEQQFLVAGNALGYIGRVQALENLGRVSVLLKKDDQAKDSFHRALQINPNSVISLLELSDLALQAGDMKLAGEYFQKYMSLVGKDKLGERSLWLGARIANGLGDSIGFSQFAHELNMRFPSSAEAQYANQILQYRQ